MTDKSNFKVRPYYKNDYSQVISLWQKTGLGNPERGDNESTIEKTIEMGGSLLILENQDSGIVCGTSWITFDGRRLHLHHFGIDPELQGRGYSHMLLKESLEFVKRKGVQVKLEVHQSNEIAISLYKKYGFTYLGDYRVYIIRDINTI